MTPIRLHFLEVTDEMIRAFEHAEVGSSVTESDDIRAGLTAVLALVERDHAIGPVMCDATAHPPEPLAYCELPRGHQGEHSATVERAVQW
jgi:hypothetical protein